MAKSVICITLNPAIDRTGRITSLQAGQTNIVHESFDRFGGKGINMADVLVQFGTSAIASGLMGSKSVADFKNNLQSRGIQYAFSTVPGETRQRIKLIDQNDKITDISFPAFNCSADDVDLVLAMVAAYDFDYIALGGSLPLSLPADTYAYMIKELKKLNKKVLLDTSGVALKEAIKEQPWFIKPNNFELEDLMGEKFKSIKSMADCAQSLQKKGIQNVIISLGKKGAIYCGVTGCFYAKAPAQNSVSSIGAGDTLVGSWLAEKIRGKSDKEAAITATANSALSVTHLGVGQTSVAELEALKKKVEIKQFQPI